MVFTFAFPNIRSDDEAKHAALSLQTTTFHTTCMPKQHPLLSKLHFASSNILCNHASITYDRRNVFPPPLPPVSLRPTTKRHSKYVPIPLPSTSLTCIPTAQIPPTAGLTTSGPTPTAAAGLPPVQSTGSIPFTYTVPTTSWSPPTFPTSAPETLPLCSSVVDLCPSQNGKRCIDTMGAIYGVVCGMRFSGSVITSFGRMEKRGGEVELDAGAGDGEKRHSMRKRAYYSTLDYCLQSCDQYNSTLCVGADFQGGNCMAFSNIFGTLATEGKLALVRLS